MNEKQVSDGSLLVLTIELEFESYGNLIRSVVALFMRNVVVVVVAVIVNVARWMCVSVIGVDSQVTSQHTNMMSHLQLSRNSMLVCRLRCLIDLLPLIFLHFFCVHRKQKIEFSSLSWAFVHEDQMHL